MRIYIAGIGTQIGGNRYTLDQANYPYLLESYYYLTKGSDSIEDFRGRRLFLDSGAFSAFTKGVKIDIEEYARYVIKNKTIVEVAANLDDLSNDKEAAAKNTAVNQKRLEALTRGSGVPIIPVFHCREDTKWLKLLMDKYEHIALGGMVPESTPWLRGWLDDLFTRFICNPDGTPRVKVHGFGLTTFDLMFRYPFYSVDSTSWVLVARYGSILIPRGAEGVTKVCISSDSPRVHDWDAHFDTMSTVEKKKVEQMIGDAGFDPEELRITYWKRDLFNIWALRQMCDKPIRPFRRQSASLF
jgi:hypothetical protein